MFFLKKTHIFIFVVAMIMRLLALHSFAEEKSLLYVSDSLTYLQVGKNLITHGIYSMEVSSTPHPDNFRTPLYPLFLIPFIWLKTSLYVPAIVQNIFMSLGIVVFLFLSQKIFGRAESLLAACFFALEPFTALISSQIMTEAIFVPLFLLSLLLVALYIKNKKIVNLISGAIFLALAALTRPIAFYLFLTIPLAVLLAEKNKKLFLKNSFLALVSFFIVVSPWLLFNAIKLNTAEFSSVSNMQFYAYHGRMFDEWRHRNDTSTNDRLPQLDLSTINDTFDARAIPLIKSTGLRYLKAHWSEYLIYHFIRLPSLYTDSGYASILNGLPFLKFNYDTVKGGFFDQLTVGKFSDVLHTIVSQPLFLVLLFADLFFILIALLALLNPLFHYLIHKKIPAFILWLILVLSIYTIIASPIGGARFRIPINPILFILAMNSLFLFNGWRKEKQLTKTL